MNGDKVWFELVRVAKCAHESFPDGFRVIGKCSSSRKDVLSNDDGDRERRSTGDGRVNASCPASASASSSSSLVSCEVRVGVASEEAGVNPVVVVVVEVRLKLGIDVLRTIEFPVRLCPYAEYDGGGGCRGNGNRALEAPEADDEDEKCCARPIPSGGPPKLPDRLRA